MVQSGHGSPWLIMVYFCHIAMFVKGYVGLRWQVLFITLWWRVMFITLRWWVMFFALLCLWRVMFDCNTLWHSSRVMLDCDVRQGIMADFRHIATFSKRCHIAAFVKGSVWLWCSLMIMLHCDIHLCCVMSNCYVCLWLHHIVTFIKCYDTLQNSLRVMFHWDVPKWPWCIVIFILVDL
jgi:hypothetical protein